MREGWLSGKGALPRAVPNRAQSTMASGNGEARTRYQHNPVRVTAWHFTARTWFLFRFLSSNEHTNPMLRWHSEVHYAPGDPPQHSGSSTGLLLTALFCKVYASS